MHEYRVVDLLTATVDFEPVTVTAENPEKAAELVLGVLLVRSGAERHLRAKVYYHNPGFPGAPASMVRLYTKVAERTELLA